MLSLYSLSVSYRKYFPVPEFGDVAALPFHKPFVIGVVAAFSSPSFFAISSARASDAKATNFRE